MATTKLTIQHNNLLLEPPIEDGVKIEWERTGSPGKLTFTALKTADNWVEFTEGDPVCFYVDDKPIFIGYIFKKKRDREQRIEVTCYDQIRYLKNKYTYVFENKTATQIIKALCNDFNLQIGSMDNTKYVIPSVAKENISALDIILDVLEETLTNSENMFVFYDDAGKLMVKNCTTMLSTTLIMEETAENFDYSSSIDDETYNNVVLYYKDGDDNLVLYTAHSPSKIKEWGNLRYFDEVKTPTSAQNKANALLNLFNRKTRELKVTGAFGDATVRGGTMIPTRLDLGDIVLNNYLVVEKVTHNFNKDHHTMDLTLQGYWEDYVNDGVSQTIGQLKPEETKPNGTNSSGVTDKPKETVEYATIRVNISGENKPTYQLITLDDNGKETGDSGVFSGVRDFKLAVGTKIKIKTDSNNQMLGNAQTIDIFDSASGKHLYQDTDGKMDHKTWYGVTVPINIHNVTVNYTVEKNSTITITWRDYWEGHWMDYLG